MHVVIAPDKFKGSLTAQAVADRIGDGIRSVRRDLEIVRLPVADGGDGTLAAMIAGGFQRVDVRATGPTGSIVETAYARRGTTAVVELAAVCGLLRLPGGRSAPMTASSYGLGEVVSAAVGAGARRVVIGLGGSASTDGGAGFLQALGFDLRGRDGATLDRGGGALAEVQSIDLSSGPDELRDIRFIVAGDVDNPLCGPHGAAAVYGPQKGADHEQLTELDRALGRWANVVAERSGSDLRDRAGAGAAGGVGFAAAAVLGARLVPGIELILQLIGFRARLDGCRLVVTGEGSLDAQTLAGKAPFGVANAARAAGVPTVAVCGRNSLDRAQLNEAGIDAFYALTDIEADERRSLMQAGALLERVGAAIATDHLS